MTARLTDDGRSQSITGNGASQFDEDGEEVPLRRRKNGQARP